jgi:hypothetical protein
METLAQRYKKFLRGVRTEKLVLQNYVRALARSVERTASLKLVDDDAIDVYNHALDTDLARWVGSVERIETLCPGATLALETRWCDTQITRYELCNCAQITNYLTSNRLQFPSYEKLATTLITLNLESYAYLYGAWLRLGLTPSPYLSYLHAVATASTSEIVFALEDSSHVKIMHRNNELRLIVDGLQYRLNGEFVYGSGGMLVTEV